ncbi:MAG: cupredoxin domain-containing protein [Dehalococcoidia bacterium]
MPVRKSFVSIAGVALLALMLLASACGSSSSGDASGVAQGVEGVPDGSPFIDQHNLRFNPKSLTTSAGEEVYFKNSETTIHTVTIDGKNESGTMNRNDVFTWTPPGPGTYKITCEFHPQMKAAITVQ